MIASYAKHSINFHFLLGAVLLKNEKAQKIDLFFSFIFHSTLKFFINIEKKVLHKEDSLTWRRITIQGERRENWSTCVYLSMLQGSFQHTKYNFYYFFQKFSFLWIPQCTCTSILFIYHKQNFFLFCSFHNTRKKKWKVLLSLSPLFVENDMILFSSLCTTYLIKKSFSFFKCTLIIFLSINKKLYTMMVDVLNKFWPSFLPIFTLMYVLIIYWICMLKQCLPLLLCVLLTFAFTHHC